MTTRTNTPITTLLVIVVSFACFQCLAQDEGTVQANPGAQSVPYLATETGEFIPLLLTEVEVTIDGVIADVRITQHFTNDRSKPIEALYVFPGSTRAAVYAVEMSIGDRIVNARIAEKTEARQAYDEAVQQGRTASLLDQIDPQFFSMRVGNIFPDDDVRVTLRYVEEVEMLPSKYRLVIPARRAASVLGIGSTKREGPVLEDESASGFHLHGSILAPVPIRTIHSPSHDLAVESISRTTGTFALAENELFAARSDVVIEYQLADETMQTGLTVFEGESHDYFLVLAQPPARASAAQIPPREYIFVVDVSGSMDGFPLSAARRLMGHLLSRLQNRDRFNVVVFAGAAGKLYPSSVLASSGSIQHAMDFLHDADAAGTTDLLSALRLAHESAPTRGVARSVVVITDGGIYLPDETLRFVSGQLSDANLFALGVGAGTDHPVIESLARVGRGQALVLADEATLTADVGAVADYVGSPLLTDVRLLLPERAEVETLPVALPDVFLKRPVFAVGRMRKIPGDHSHVAVQGESSEGLFQVNFDLATAPRGGKAIAYLWARERLRQLETDASEIARRDGMTAIGLEFGLLTPFTSFVAIDEEARVEGGGVDEVELNRVEVVGSRARISVGFSLSAVELASTIAAMTPANIDASAGTVGDSQGRPSITLIGKDGASDPGFLTAAGQFFSENGEFGTEHVLGDITDLLAAREALVAHAGEEPWGVINLVVHGSPWSGLALAMGPDQSNVSVQALADSRAPEWLPSHVIDARTQIRVFACGVGRQPRLLEGLSRWFASAAGTPLVRASSDQSYFIQAQGEVIAATLHHPWLLERRQPDPEVVLRRLGGPPGGQVRIEPVVVTYRGAVGTSRANPSSLARRVDALRDYFKPLGVATSELRWSLEGGALIGRAWLAQYVPRAVAATRLSEAVINEWPAVRAGSVHP